MVLPLGTENNVRRRKTFPSILVKPILLIGFRDTTLIGPAIDLFEIMCKT
jgi:hypothetical protein